MTTTSQFNKPPTLLRIPPCLILRHREGRHKIYNTMQTSLQELPPLRIHPAEPAVDRSWSGDVELLNRDASVQLWLDQTAFQHSSSPESYDIVHSSGQLLKTPCESGVLNVFADRKFWHVSGGIITPESIKPEVIHWMKQIAETQKIGIAVYSVNESELPHYISEGYEYTKFGEEPILDLGDLEWKGKPFEWVRRQTNFCQRAGLRVTEIANHQIDETIAQEMNEIIDQDLSSRTFTKPLRLLVGEFNSSELHRKRLFVVQAENSNRIEAFLACNPMQNGTQWAFETFRKRNDCPRGAMAFLFRTVIDQLQDEGVDRVSLCLVPGRGVEEWNGERTYKLTHTLLKLWYRRMNFLFNVRGQEHFKARFRPRFESRYLCVTPHSSLYSVYSFLKTVGALYPNYYNLACRIMGRS